MAKENLHRAWTNENSRQVAMSELFSKRLFSVEMEVHVPTCYTSCWTLTWTWTLCLNHVTVPVTQAHLTLKQALILTGQRHTGGVVVVYAKLQSSPLPFWKFSLDFEFYTWKSTTVFQAELIAVQNYKVHVCPRLRSRRFGTGRTREEVT